MPLTKGNHVSRPGAPVSLHLRECRAPAAVKPGPSVGERLEVCCPRDDAWYPGTVADISVTGRHHIEYDNGEEERLLLSEELTRNIERQLADDESGDVVPVSDWTSALRKRWRGELGASRFTELAVQMQEQALGAATRGNYDLKAKGFRDVCEEEGREWLPVAEDTVRLYIAALLEKGGIQAMSMQPYLSAINNYHEDMGVPGPAKGRGVSRAVKGMARLQVAAAQEAGVTVTERTWLLAKHVRTVHEAALTLVPDSEEQLLWLRACTFVVLSFLSFGRPDTGSSLQQENVLTEYDGVTAVLTRKKGRNHVSKKRQLSIPCSAGSDTDLANAWLRLALSTVGCVPPEGGHFSAHSTRKGATTCTRTVGVAMEKVCFLGEWSQLPSAVQAYIHPTAVPDQAMRSYFGWVAPQGVCAQERR
eukprot:gene5762-biopygen5782